MILRKNALAFKKCGKIKKEKQLEISAFSARNLIFNKIIHRHLAH